MPCFLVWATLWRCWSDVRRLLILLTTHVLQEMSEMASYPAIRLIKRLIMVRPNFIHVP